MLIALTGQTWAQTVQPTHWVRSMNALPFSMEIAGQPTFRQLLQLRHLSALTTHMPTWGFWRLMSRHGRRVMMAAGTSEASAFCTACSMASAALAELGYTGIYEFGGINTWPYETES